MSQGFALGGRIFICVSRAAPGGNPWAILLGYDGHSGPCYASAARRSQLQHRDCRHAYCPGMVCCCPFIHHFLCYHNVYTGPNITGRLLNLMLTRLIVLQGVPMPAFLPSLSGGAPGTMTMAIPLGIVGPFQVPVPVQVAGPSQVHTRTECGSISPRLATFLPDSLSQSLILETKQPDCKKREAAHMLLSIIEHNSRLESKHSFVK